MRRGYFLAALRVPVAWPGNALVRTESGAMLDRDKYTKGFT